jgi:inosine-uridine nucleoside N-ribohydrolase
MKPKLVALVVVVLLLAGACGDGAPSEGTDPPPSAPSTQTGMPVILDGDFGPDDMMALVYLLQQPDVDLLAVTVTGTGLVHCPDGAANAAAVLSHLGRPEIPVGCGEAEPLSGNNAFPEEWRTGADTLAGALGLDVDNAPEVDAVDLLAKTIASAESPVHLLVLGPSTNLAQAFERDPELDKGIAEIVMMGGAVEARGSVPPDFAAEWNLWVDPVATEAVFESGVPLRLVPLDATNHVPATRFFVDALEEQKETAAAELIWRYFDTYGYGAIGPSVFFWDPLAAVSLVRPELVVFEERTLAVVTDLGAAFGAVVETPSGTPVQVAISVDRAVFEEEYLSALNDQASVEVFVPQADLIVTYTGSACTYEGKTDFETAGDTAEVYLEVVNQTDWNVAVVTGLHPGVTWEELVAVAAAIETGAEPPSFWEETGIVVLPGEAVTGGSTIESLSLAAGHHALVCSDENGQLYPVVDLIVEHGSR